MQTAPPLLMATYCPSLCSGRATQTARCRLDAKTPTILFIPAASRASWSSRPAAPAHVSGGRSAQNALVRRQRRCSTPTAAIHLLKVRLPPIQTRDFSSPLPFHSLEFAECLAPVRLLIRTTCSPPT